MSLAADSLSLCEAASAMAHSLFVDSAFDSSQRHLMKCYLNKHFVPGHSVCLKLFEGSLTELVAEATGNLDAQWHLRFINGFQLMSECDSSIRLLLSSTSSCPQKIVDYFSFAINKFATAAANESCSDGKLVYLEAKLLLKSVQVFSRIFGKIQNNRSVSCPPQLIYALWSLAASDFCELDVRQASANLILQLESSSLSYDSFKSHAGMLINKNVPDRRSSAAVKNCLIIIGTGAFCSQLPAHRLAAEVSPEDSRTLLLVLLEDLASCHSPSMSTSLSIAFYRSLLCWTKAASLTSSVGIWDSSNIQQVFTLFLQLIENGWDSHAEVVRDLASDAFLNLLTLYGQLKALMADGGEAFLRDLVCTLLRTDWQSRLKYRPLAQITKSFGPDILFACAKNLDVDIPSKVGGAFVDRAIAPHGATFITAVVESAIGHSGCAFDERQFTQELIRSVVETAAIDESVTRHFVTFAVPKLLKARGRRVIEIIVNQTAADNMADAEYLILFSACRSARSIGLYELENFEALDEEPKIFLLLKRALNHSNMHIRLEAFGFLCENIRVGQPLWPWELDDIERFAVAALKTDSSDFRQSYTSFFRKFLVRLRDSGNAIQRNQTHPDLLARYAAFLDRHIGLCLECLAFQGAAFARRATALSLLVVTARTWATNSPTWFDLKLALFERRPAVSILLATMVQDTYEENKKLAFDLLTLFWVESEAKLDKSQLLAKAVEFSQSTHPQNGVTAAFLYKLLATSCSGEIIEKILEPLLTSLADQLQVAEADLAKAAISRPMYPTLISIRYVIAGFRSALAEKTRIFADFCRRLVRKLEAVSDAVSPVVSHQSPEGMTVDDDEDENNELLPEFLTVCCWRCIKEVSLTLSLLVEIAIEQGDLLLKKEEIEAIGGYFSGMLLTARHRGAFEIAYAGFDHICAKLWQAPSTRLNSLPAAWLRPLLATGDNVSLSATRRSAGLPFYFQAVVANEPRLTRSLGVSLLETVLNLLVTRACQTDNENVCIHALNILRALVRDSRLEQAISPFVGDAFIAALTALSSKKWSLRNAGTLLFSALLSRVFGVHRERFTPAKKNCMTGRMFFGFYPKLFQFVLSYFANSSHVETTSSVVVVLLSLFEHLYPSPFDASDAEDGGNGVFSFVPALIDLLRHPAVRIRVMASRSIRNFVTVESLPVLLASLLDRQPTSNFIDGCLILLRKLAVMFSKDAEALKIIFDVAVVVIDLASGNSFLLASIVHFLLTAINLQPELVSLANSVAEKALAAYSGPPTLLIRSVQCSIFAKSIGENPDLNATIEKYLAHSNRFVRATAVDCLNQSLLGEFLRKTEFPPSEIFTSQLGQDDDFLIISNHPSPLLDKKSIFQLAWQDLQKISTLAGRESEVSKLLNLISFCVLLEPDVLLQPDNTAASIFDKASVAMATTGHLAESSLRVFGAVAPFVSPAQQAKIIAILLELVSTSDDSSYFQLSLFALSRLPFEGVAANDAACEVVLACLTSSDSDVRALASWFVIGKSAGVGISSLNSGQALAVFVVFVAKTRGNLPAVEWLLQTATTPKRTMTSAVGGDFQMVFEAEETNPFAEDRLVSNICVLVLSALLNGAEKTLAKVFPQLRLPGPIKLSLTTAFPTATVDDKSVLATVANLQLFPSGVQYSSRNELASTIETSALAWADDADFAKKMKTNLPMQSAMLRSDVVYQRLLVAKVLRAADLGANLVPTFGDSPKLDTLLIC